MSGTLSVCIPLMNVTIRGEVRELKSPINLTVEIGKDGNYIVSNNDFHFLAVAPTIREALENINEEFAGNWEAYVEEEEFKLTTGALKFREKLLGCI